MTNGVTVRRSTTTLSIKWNSDLETNAARRRWGRWNRKRPRKNTFWRWTRRFLRIRCSFCRSKRSAAFVLYRIRLYFESYNVYSVNRSIHWNLWVAVCCWRGPTRKRYSLLCLDDEYDYVQHGRLSMFRCINWNILKEAHLRCWNHSTVSALASVVSLCALSYIHFSSVCVDKTMSV